VWNRMPNRLERWLLPHGRAHWKSEFRRLKPIVSIDRRPRLYFGFSTRLIVLLPERGTERGEETLTTNTFRIDRSGILRAKGLVEARSRRFDRRGRSQFASHK